MSSLQKAIIIILVIIVAGLAIALAVSSKIKNNEIARLGELNAQLTTQIGKAESMMELQNTQIEAFKIDAAEREAAWHAEIDNITLYYENKLQVSSDNKTCQEILAIINNNQLEFLKK